MDPLVLSELCLRRRPCDCFVLYVLVVALWRLARGESRNKTKGANQTKRAFTQLTVGIGDAVADG